MKRNRVSLTARVILGWLPMGALAALLSTPTAHAEVAKRAEPGSGASDADRKDDVAFQSWARQYARAHRLSIADWGRAQLDDDAAPERWARLCPSKEPPPDGSEEMEGDALYLVADTSAQRWSFQIRLDRTPCEDGAGPPRWQLEAPKTLDIDSAFHQGESTLSVALRGGVPVIVAESTEDRSGADEETVETDYDRLTVVQENRIGGKRPRVRRATILVIDGGKQRIELPRSRVPLLIDASRGQRAGKATLTVAVSSDPPSPGHFDILLGGRTQQADGTAASFVFPLSDFGPLDGALQIEIKFRGVRGTASNTELINLGLLLPTRYPAPQALKVE